MAVAWLLVSLISKAEDSIPPKPTSHTIRQIEGWTVRVDDRLISGPERELSQHTLRILSNRLYDIKFILPADKVARLQKVTIQIDLTHGKLTSAQYHPSVDWLQENGYATNLVQCVHIPDASDFSNLNHQKVQPWSVLHELAHAYHDQVLGFEQPEIMAAYQAFKNSGKYDSVLHINGRQTRHYAPIKKNSSPR